MKRFLIILILFLINYPNVLRACEVCQNNQPKMLKNITHGTGSQGNTDYIIIWSAVVIVAVTLFFSIKFLIRPKEAAPDHIKNITIE